ncbi:MAG: cysteine--tRNA ligase [Alphaproteobacteria bacterium]
MGLSIYNTLTRRKEVFTPLHPDRVALYVCGPTVYNYAHIGNARPPVVFDVLTRLLRRHYQVTYVRNITDVDDKINKTSQETGRSIRDITDEYTKAYHQDMAVLGVLPPDIEPRVTDHISHIIGMIKALITAKHAYTAEGHVLFHVPSYADYGQLSKRSQDEMIAGARVEVAPYKKNPADFVLWKPSSPDLPGWDSPWGRGRPGWHIECSAMVEAHLGTTIDIHGGGLDLVFPHHENEIAQGTCAHRGALYARYWMHNGFVNVEQEKMSKSLGNVLLVRDLLRDNPGEAVRLALLSAHYRQPLDWSQDGVQQAKRVLDRLYGTLRQLESTPFETREASEAVITALEDDLNTPAAFAALFEIAHQANTATTKEEKIRLKGELLASGQLMGLLQQNPEHWFTADHHNIGLSSSEIEALITARTDARKARNFMEADRIRDHLAQSGIVIEDRPDGVLWRRS